MRFWRGTLAGASSMCLDWMSVILLKPSLSLEYKFLPVQSCFLASLTWRSPPLFAGTIQTIPAFSTSCSCRPGLEILGLWEIMTVSVERVCHVFSAKISRYSAVPNLQLNLNQDRKALGLILGGEEHGRKRQGRMSGDKTEKQQTSQSYQRSQGNANTMETRWGASEQRSARKREEWEKGEGKVGRKLCPLWYSSAQRDFVREERWLRETGKINVQSCF